MTADPDPILHPKQREIDELRENIVAGNDDAALDLVQRLFPSAHHLPRRHFETILAERKASRNEGQ